MNESAHEKLRTLPDYVTEEHIAVIFEAFDLNLEPLVWRVLNALKDSGFDKEQVISVRRSLTSTSSQSVQRQCPTESNRVLGEVSKARSVPKFTNPGGQGSSRPTDSHVPFGVMKHLELGSQPSYVQTKTPEYAVHQNKPRTRIQNIFNLQNVSCFCCGRPYNVEKPYCRLCGQEYLYEAALSKHQRQCNGKETKRGTKPGTTGSSTRRSETNDTDPSLPATEDDPARRPEHQSEGPQLGNCKADAAGYLEGTSSWPDFCLSSPTFRKELDTQMDRTFDYPNIDEVEMQTLLGRDLQEPVIDGYAYYWYCE